MKKLDCDFETKRICEFIRKQVQDAKATGAVIGMSGGVDSGLVAALCVKALGKDNVFGLMMPLSFTPSKDTEDAIQQAKELGIEYKVIPIENCVAEFIEAVEGSGNEIPIMNVRSRMRMVILYYFANKLNRLVAGTGDRSEDLIGFFTKYGDGGVDFLPISHLYKGQVRELAKHLGVPKAIYDKPSSPQLRPGHEATQEIPLPYEKLDLVLQQLFDEKRAATYIAKTVCVTHEAVQKVIEMNKRSEHKRKYPAMVVEW